MMMNVRWRATALFLLTSIYPLTGCGSSLGSMSGKVTYEGEAVANGSITFTPADGKGNVTGGMITDGSYSVTEIPPGKMIVSIAAVKDVPFARSSEEMAKRAAEQRQQGNDSGLIDPADIIPPNAIGNQTEVTIAAGSQSRDFDLKKPASK